MCLMELRLTLPPSYQISACDELRGRGVTLGIAVSSVSFGGNHPLEEDGTRHPQVASVEPRMILVPEGRDSLLAGNGNVSEAGESVTIGVDMIKLL